jgi:DNA-binding MarR family transcriptional regulator
MAEGRPARIGFLIAQLGAHASELFADLVRELGVSPSEAGVIRIVGRHPGISQRELADKLGSVQSRVVALIDRLESAGYVARTRRADDRRIQQLDLTDAGRMLLSELRGAAQAQEAALTTGLDDDQKATLSELLAAMSKAQGLDADVHPGYASATPAPRAPRAPRAAAGTPADAES